MDGFYVLLLPFQNSSYLGHCALRVESDFEEGRFVGNWQNFLANFAIILSRQNWSAIFTAAQ